MVDQIQIERSPKLSRPVMICAFRGWNDAGSAASLAAGYLRSVTDAERFAVIDCDPFVDFQQTRPMVRLSEGLIREIEWPDTELYASEEHNLVVLIGSEPNMRWRAFAAQIAELAKRVGVDMVLTLGALLADTPHSRPVPVQATASDPEMIERLGLTRSNYEGPTGIVGVLHDACARAGLRSASLWAATPHYISAAPNPRAAAAILERLADLVGTPGPSAELQRAASEYALRVAAAIADDPEIAAYVEQLEQQAAEAEEADPPTGDQLAADFERYLREQGDDGPTL
jgi:predicted ATP-grasp superfamily ATP-dependent carboligase